MSLPFPIGATVILKASVTAIDVPSQYVGKTFAIIDNNCNIPEYGGLCYKVVSGRELWFVRPTDVMFANGSPGDIFEVILSGGTWET